MYSYSGARLRGDLSERHGIHALTRLVVAQDEPPPSQLRCPLHSDTMSCRHIPPSTKCAESGFGMGFGSNKFLTNTGDAFVCGFVITGPRTIPGWSATKFMFLQ